MALRNSSTSKKTLAAALLLTLSLIIAVAIALRENMRGPKRAMTAIEYYDYLLTKNGYSAKDIAKRKDELLQHLAEDPQWQKLGAAGQAELRESAGPNLGLSLLLHDVLRAVPQRYQPVPSDIVAAEFPLPDINARTVRAPNGGVLILLNAGLTKSLHEWSKIIANIIFDTKQEGLPTGSKQANWPTDAPRAMLTDEFVKSIQDYRRGGDLPSFPTYATDAKSVMVGILTLAATEFILAHEFAHAALGDLVREPTEPEDRSTAHFWKHEIEVDHAAAEILLNDPPGVSREIDRDMRIAGIWYALGILSMIETSMPADPKDPNLQMYDRLGQMIVYVETTFGLPKSAFANDAAKALNDLRAQVAGATSRQAEMSQSDKQQNALYRAYRNNHAVRMTELVAADLNGVRAWVRKLLTNTLTMARLNIDVAGPWSDGKYLSAADVYEFVYTVNSVIQKLDERAGLKQIERFCVRLISEVEHDAKDYQAKLASAGQHEWDVRDRLVSWLRTHAPNMAAFQSGLSAYDAGDYAQALEIWLPQARAGNAEAQSFLALMYLQGTGGDKDMTAAADWARRAADQGFPAAQNQLGAMYLNGQGVPQDYNQAVFWFRSAATLGDANGAHDLGFVYFSGQGVARNVAEAVKWFEEGGARGHPGCLFNLADAYANGDGVPQDARRAYVYYALSAELATSDQDRSEALQARDAAAATLSVGDREKLTSAARDWKSRLSLSASEDLMRSGAEPLSSIWKALDSQQ